MYAVFLGHHGTDYVQDISARSPVFQNEAKPRQSLDASFAYQPRKSATFNHPEPTREEEFEDVGLNEEKPKKRGFLSRFTDSNDEAAAPDARPSSSHHGFHLPGRKRGQSGTGAELGDMRKSSEVQGGRD